MPLIRGKSTRPKRRQSSAVDVFARLSSAAVADRREAANLLGWGEAADMASPAQIAEALSRQLYVEPEPCVREALLAALVAVGGSGVAEELAPFLRHPDAALRNGALMALKLLGEAAIPVVDSLLHDPDPDVRLLSAEVMRSWSLELASPRLLRRLAEEENANVAGVLVDVTLSMGDASLCEPLRACGVRFPEEGFLSFAIGVAIVALAEAGSPP